MGFCSESSVPKVRKIGIFLKNILNIEKKCYSPVVPGFLVHDLSLTVLKSVS